MVEDWFLAMVSGSIFTWMEERIAGGSIMNIGCLIL